MLKLVARGSSQITLLKLPLQPLAISPNRNLVQRALDAPLAAAAVAAVPVVALVRCHRFDTNLGRSTRLTCFFCLLTEKSQTAVHGSYYPPARVCIVF